MTTTCLYRRMEWDEQAAVARARAGDQDAFRDLVERHSRSLFKVAVRITGNGHDAEEVVQEAFLKAFRGLHRFEARASIATWLHRIAVNCAYNFVRSRNRHDHDEASEVPDRPAENHDAGFEVATAMAALTDAERTAFALRHFEGYSIDEIGAVLGLRESATKNTVFRAVQKLRRSLAPQAALRQTHASD